MNWRLRQQCVGEEIVPCDQLVSDTGDYTKQIPGGVLDGIVMRHAIGQSEKLGLGVSNSTIAIQCNSRAPAEGAPRRMIAPQAAEVDSARQAE